MRVSSGLREADRQTHPQVIFVIWKSLNITQTQFSFYSQFLSQRIIGILRAKMSRNHIFLGSPPLSKYSVPWGRVCWLEMVLLWAENGHTWARNYHTSRSAKSRGCSSAQNNLRPSQLLSIIATFSRERPEPAWLPRCKKDQKPSVCGGAVEVISRGSDKHLGAIAAPSLSAAWASAEAVPANEPCLLHPKWAYKSQICKYLLSYFP